MDFITENGIITFFLKGSLNVDNAERVQNEILSILADHPDEKIIFDADELMHSICTFL